MKQTWLISCTLLVAGSLPQPLTAEGGFVQGFQRLALDSGEYLGIKIALQCLEKTSYLTKVSAYLVVHWGGCHPKYVGTLLLLFARDKTSVKAGYDLGFYCTARQCCSRPYRATTAR